MSAGTLIYSSGLIGTQPVHISQGGATATMVGKADINPLSFPITIGNCGLISSGNSYSSTNTLTSISYPQVYIIKNTPSTTLIDYYFTAGTLTQDFFNSNASTILGELYVPITASTNVTFGHSGSGNNGSVAFTLEEISLSSLLNISTDATFTIKASDSDLTSPATNFAAWGIEVDTTAYTNMSDYSDADYYTLSNTYLGAEITGLTSFEKIFPLIARNGGAFTGYIWNFDTSAWVAFGSGTTLGSTSGSRQGIPGGKTFDSTNYISGGKAYLKLTNGGTIGFLGLYQYNPIHNA